MKYLKKLLKYLNLNKEIKLYSLKNVRYGWKKLRMTEIKEK